MKNEVESAAGGRNESDIPVMVMDGYPVGEMHGLDGWYWPGWQYVMVVGQVVVLTGLFLYSGPLIRWFDATAGVLDAGIWSVCMLAVLVTDTVVVSAWLLLRLVRNTLTEYEEWDVEQGELTKGITACVKVKILVWSFWGFVLLCSGLFVVLL